jgi:glycosyltransferase involved in cell wall biosynthesis
MYNPLVSVVIDNYNYERFLGPAIESALSQTYPYTEIVVVDDGSTDNSQNVIESYRGRVIPVLKENGGQASAFNAGVARATGEIICFLDSDDLWYPEKVAQVVKTFGPISSDKPILVHHFLDILDESNGKAPIKVIGNKHSSPCNLYEDAKRHRYIPYIAGPTSSISINRSLVSALFPLPERSIRTSADDFIVFTASIIGEVHSVDSVLGQYRVHGSNYWFTSNRTKPVEFVVALDSFMNEKLVESGREPCVSFYDSMFRWNDLLNDGRWISLFVSMGKLVVLQRDRLTLKFVYEILKQIFNKTPLRRFSVFHRIVESTRPIRIRLLGW